MKLTNKLILWLIIMISALLRFYNLFDIPYTHDEFSALFRTYYSGFSELIEKGVKTVDVHPAGIQVFLYYWTKLFGYSEWVVKFPFIIAGVFSVYLIYLIAKEWYNESVGLISASFLASIQFTIMFSQIARPYSSGLFFSLLMVLFWTRIMLYPEKNFIKNSLLFVVSAALCAYNHYFSLLFAVIVGFSGLFLIKKDFLVKYILSGIIIGLLFLPHANIFFHHISLGGIEGWLGKPDNNFIIDYLFYIFNYSMLVLFVVIVLVLYGIVSKEKWIVDTRKYLLFASWFFLPFLIGFFYSKYVNAVLQYTVLIFSFPFLFLLLFGHLKLQKPFTNLLLVLVILSVNIFSLIHNRQHYAIFYKSFYENVLIDHEKVQVNYPKTLSIIDSHKRISGYYINKFDIDTSFIWFDTFENEYDLVKFLEKNEGEQDYLYLGSIYSNNTNTVPIIKRFYPNVEWQKNYIGGTTYLFSKKYSNNLDDLVSVLDLNSGLEDRWQSVDITKHGIENGGNSVYLLDSLSEFSPNMSEKLNAIFPRKNDYLDVSVRVKLLTGVENPEILLVIVVNEENKLIHWSASSYNSFVGGNNQKDQWVTVHHSVQIPDRYIKSGNLELMTYVWNKGLHNFLIDNFEIRYREGNNILYWWVDRI